MVEVHLWSGLRSLVGGRESVEVEAETVGQMLSALAAEYPGLQDAIDAGVSVSVDGRIIASSLNEPVSPQSEVYLLQRIRGG